MAKGCYKKVISITEEKMKEMKNKIDAMLSRLQLYSYLLPTVKIGNAIMDFREKYTLSEL